MKREDVGNWQVIELLLIQWAVALKCYLETNSFLFGRVVLILLKKKSNQKKKMIISTKKSEKSSADHYDNAT